MLTVVQRVSEAKVVVDNQVVGEIAQGLMILCGFEVHDSTPTLLRMVEKCLHYRIFDDEQGKMNRSLQDVKGGLLLVPQFTLMAETNKGLRPSFSKAASPQSAQTLFQQLLHLAREKYPYVASGQFGAEMKVYLCNDGPVTFLLQF